MSNMFLIDNMIVCAKFNGKEKGIYMYKLLVEWYTPTECKFRRRFFKISDADFNTAIPLLTLAQQKGLEITKGYKIKCWVKDRNGNKNGLFEQYNSEHRLDVRCTFKDDKENGLYRVYNTKTGYLGAQIMCKDGEFNGLSKFYNEDGDLESEFFYQNGNRILDWEHRKSAVAALVGSLRTRKR